MGFKKEKSQQFWQVLIAKNHKQMLEGPWVCVYIRSVCVCIRSVCVCVCVCIRAVCVSLVEGLNLSASVSSCVSSRSSSAADGLFDQHSW